MDPQEKEIHEMCSTSTLAVSLGVFSKLRPREVMLRQRTPLWVRETEVVAPGCGDGRNLKDRVLERRKPCKQVPTI